MNLYEITDIKTGKTIEPAVTLKKGSRKTEVFQKCSIRSLLWELCNWT